MGITVVIASDPQLRWWRGRGPQEALKDLAWKSNNEQAMAIDRVFELTWPDERGGVVETPKAVIVNGDLTEWWLEGLSPGSVNQPNELMEQFLDRIWYPIYPGLGNHDYEINVGKNEVGDKNLSAKRAVWWMDGWVRRNQDRIVSYDANIRSNDQDDLVGSLAYSFNIGYMHFVQLQYRPDYTCTLDRYFVVPKVEIKTSWEWLQRISTRQPKKGAPSWSTCIRTMKSGQLNLRTLPVARMLLPFSGVICIQSWAATTNLSRAPTFRISTALPRSIAHFCWQSLRTATCVCAALTVSLGIPSSGQPPSQTTLKKCLTPRYNPGSSMVLRRPDRSGWYYKHGMTGSSLLLRRILSLQTSKTSGKRPLLRS